MVYSIQHNQPVLEIDVSPPLGVTLGDGEQFTFAQRLARTYIDQD
jgi:hypothetical protein